MKFMKVLLASAAAALAIQAGAQAASTDDRIKMLSATWTSQVSRPDGIVVEAAVSMNRDGRFSGAISADGRQLMSYEGTWKLVGHQLNWVYIKSQPELPEGLRTDSDELVSVTDGVLVLRSDRSGETRTFQRQK